MTPAGSQHCNDGEMQPSSLPQIGHEQVEEGINLCSYLEKFCYRCGKLPDNAGDPAMLVTNEREEVDDTM